MTTLGALLKCILIKFQQGPNGEEKSFEITIDGYMIQKRNEKSMKNSEISGDSDNGRESDNNIVEL